MMTCKPLWRVWAALLYLQYIRNHFCWKKSHQEKFTCAYCEDLFTASPTKKAVRIQQLERHKGFLFPGRGKGLYGILTKTKYFQKKVETFVPYPAGGMFLDYYLGWSKILPPPQKDVWLCKGRRALDVWFRHSIGNNNVNSWDRYKITFINNLESWICF